MPTPLAGHLTDSLALGAFSVLLQEECVSRLVNTHLLGAHIGSHQTLGPAHEVRTVTHQ